MNQFKKAKMKQIEAGHEVESVSGLQKTGVQEPEAEEIKESPVSENIEIPEETPKIEIEEKTQPKEESVQIKENPTPIEPIIQKIEEPIVNNIQPVSKEIPAEQAIPVPTPIPVNVQTVQTIQTYEQVQPNYIEEVIQIPKTVTKKVPNIFIQKEESKSVRKSLVLKPSSVKKAENYCVKNGGSFNELVQHLLDDFIEAYGL